MTNDHKLEVMSSTPAENVPAVEVRPEAPAEGARGVLPGMLHIYVAFDWGEEVLVERARSLVSAEVHDLPRRRRTPSSIAYRPAPLRVRLPPVEFDMPEVGQVRASAETTVFDFAAVSLALHAPFSLSPACLLRLADWLANPAGLV